MKNWLTKQSNKEKSSSYKQWTVPEPKAIFILVHGIGAYIGRWDAMGDFFLKNNISSYAIDCPEPERYHADILSLHGIASRKNPAKKIFLVGESIGALSSISMVSQRPGLFDGLVCLSPAFRNKLSLSVQSYIKIFAALIYNPRKEFKLPFESWMCTRDKDYVKKMDSDHREHRQTSARSIQEILLTQIRAGISLKNLVTPSLFLVAGDDKIADPKASIEIFRRIRVKDKTLVEYPDMYHSLSIDLGKEKVFEDILRWVEKRI